MLSSYVAFRTTTFPSIDQKNIDNTKRGRPCNLGIDVKGIEANFICGNPLANSLAFWLSTSPVLDHFYLTIARGLIFFAPQESLHGSLKTSSQTSCLILVSSASSHNLALGIFIAFL